ncbi:MAG: hypothetical protein WAU01_14805 [Saprospiraceae bacterium]
MKYILPIVFYFITIFSIQSQSPGLVVQTGVTSSFSKDKNITLAGEGHYGWMVGADARLLEGDLYFIIGLQYHQTNLKSISKINFFSENDWKLIVGRAGLGFNILRINEKLSLRSKIIGSVNFVSDAPENALNKVGYTFINDSFLGAATGLGLTIGSFDIDVEYQYGIINAYKEQPKSTFDIWTLMAGFHF